jgi:hypothetical protein
MFLVLRLANTSAGRESGIFAHLMSVLQIVLIYMKVILSVNEGSSSNVLLAFRRISKQPPTFAA